jgi:hypothetical protein
MTNTGVVGWEEEISPYDVGDEIKVAEMRRQALPQNQRGIRMS